MNIIKMLLRGAQRVVIPVSYDTAGKEKKSFDDAFATNAVIGGIGPRTQSHNRNRSAVDGSRIKVIWDAAINIRQLKPKVGLTNTVAANGAECMAIAFNPANDDIADAWLSETDSESDDVNYELVYPGDSDTYQFTAPLTRVDMKRIDGVDTLRAFYGAN